MKKYVVALLFSTLMYGCADLYGHIVEKAYITCLSKGGISRLYKASNGVFHAVCMNGESSNIGK